MLCVPIAEKGFAGLATALDSCIEYADMAEIRLDALSQPPSHEECSGLIASASVPLIFTCRKKDEGGMGDYDEKARIAMLKEVIDAGASFVDVELRTEHTLRDSLVEHAHDRGCKVIMSWHNFNKTPADSELEAVLSDQVSAGADIAKIVTMGREDADIPRLFSLYYRAAHHEIPLISFCMGEVGRLSRVACLAMGAFLSFASIDSGSETAPGQIPLKEFRKILNIAG